MNENGDSRINRNFVMQQGLGEQAEGSCGRVASAHLFQPRVIGPIVLIATLLQSAGIFLTLSAVLWWCALVPRYNPFDAIYNATLGARPGAVHLGPAPAPRRFSQGMAACFALASGLLILAGAMGAALVVEIMYLIAAAAIGIGRFCLGSFIYYLVTGKGDFAVRTTPWGRGA